MDMIDKFMHSDKIDTKMFDFSGFNSLTSKIQLSKHNEIRHKIYWISAIIYRISIVNSFENIKSNKNLNLRKCDFTVFNPFVSISSEICKLISADYLYTPSTSCFARNIIEQICLINKVDEEQICTQKIIEASIVCHNRHVGAEPIDIEGLNYNNIGLFKVFKEDVKIGKLAKRYNFGWAYKFYSGDVHSVSTVSKIIPNLGNDNSAYDKAYLVTFLSLLHECFKITVKYDEVSSGYHKDDFNEYDFVEIT